MRWTFHVEGGPMRVNHAAVCIGDKIYSFGGYCSTEEFKDWEPIPVHVLDTNTLRWAPVNYQRTGAEPFQRYGHTTVAYGDKVYMWGGRNNAVACNTLSCFDTKTLTWSTPTVTGIVPNAKDGHSVCVIANKMYIYGGFEYFTDRYSKEVHCLNLDTLQWSYIDAQGTSPSLYRDFHTAVAVDDKMYIFGGRGDLNSPYNAQEELYSSQVLYLDIIEEKWVALYPSGVWPEGRRSHSSWVYKDFMYIFGGYNGIAKTHFNDLYRYSIKDNFWQYIDVGGSVPCERRLQACLIHKDVVYLFGGTSPCPFVQRRPVTVDRSADRERLFDNSDLHLLDYQPSLKTLSTLAVLENKIDTSILPRDIIVYIRLMTLPNNDISR